MNERPLFRLRPFATLCVAGAFLALALSGLLLFAAPRGRYLNEHAWAVLGLDKDAWLALHVTVAVLMLCAAGAHIVFNFKPLMNHLRGRAKDAFHLQREAVAVLAVLAVVVAGAAFNLPPTAWVVDLHEGVKDRYERAVGMPPRAMGRGAGQGASRAAAPPAAVETDPAPAPDAAPQPAEDHGERQGLGRLRVRDYAADTGIPLDDAIARLRAAGLPGDPDARLRDLASGADRRPHDIAAILRGP